MDSEPPSNPYAPQLATASLRLKLALKRAQERRRPLARRRLWVSDVLQRRDELGEYANLVQELRLNDPQRHLQYFRLNKGAFDLLQARIEDEITRSTTTSRQPVSAPQRLAVTLRYLASGEEFSALAPSYRLGESTTRAAVYTCRAIAHEREFREWWQFPNCVAAIDGKHVTIRAPPNSGSEYFNYKHQFSVVLMTAVDAMYNFAFVAVGSAGRESDGFRSLRLAQRLADGSLGLPQPSPLPGGREALPHVLVGDEVFPLLPNLMRPYPGRREGQMGDRGRVFNYRLSRARRVSENAFRILAQTWRLLLHPLNVDPEHVKLLVMTVVILHNFRRSEDAKRVEMTTENAPDAVAPTSGAHDVPALARMPSSSSHNHTRAAEQVRETFCHYFSSEGAVPWQVGL
ncbi:protein ALP1-like [Amphibalanus amphitrite]|uniref:protein ALP1-like n=1 Tax=Amphibalanus amphitrite TaxID=1232801 RepID=UPI001C917321|nr:protein ALP1-like [Amphibalanus amphitrite]